MTHYRLRQLGSQLKRGTARVVGEATTGARWPDPEHQWIVEDLERCETVHVPQDVRPSWRRYLTR